MPRTPALYNTRALSLLVLAAFAGVSLWVFSPWDGAGSSGSSGNNAGASLPAALKLDGSVDVQSENNIVTRLVVPVTVTGDTSIALGDADAVRAETAMSETASAAVPATSHSVTWLDGNGDSVADPGEHLLLTVNLPAPSTVHPDNPLRLVIRPVGGGVLVIEDVLGR